MAPADFKVRVLLNAYRDKHVHITKGQRQAILNGTAHRRPHG